MSQYDVSEKAEQFAKAMLSEAEAHRREKPTMDAHPLKGENNVAIDYGRSGQAMELAQAHLRESIPNGQRVRTEMAFRALELSVQQHKQWLLAKGYRVNS